MLTAKDIGFLGTKIRQLLLLVAMATCLGLIGCSGESDEQPKKEDPDKEDPIIQEPDTGVLSAGPIPLRRLNLREYDNSVRDLLKIDDESPSLTYQFAKDFASDTAYRFPSVTDSASPFEVGKYREAAEALAAQVNIDNVFSCRSSMPSTSKSGPKVEAENFDQSSPSSPFTVQNDGGRSIVVWPGTGGEHLTPTNDATGQLFYSLVANAQSLTVHITANFGSATEDSFHYMLDGKDSTWTTQNNMNTAGYQEIQLATWSGLQVGKTYQLKIQRREDGAKIDSFRAVGGVFAEGAAALNEQACAELFVEQFGLKAYRRPLGQSEATRLVDFYNTSRQDPLNLSHEDGLRLIVEILIQSPSFLYRREIGDNMPTMNNGLIRLDSYEVASRLSYFIWRSMPDDELFELAAANGLSTNAQVAAQARKMLQNQKARESITSFFEYWLTYNDLLSISKDQRAYPEFDVDMKRAMLEEARAFVANIIFDGDAQFESLFTSSSSFVNEELADIYGLSSIRGDSLQPAELDSRQRGGLLTLSAFLADKGAADGSNPALRGSALFEQLLCEHLPPPPNVIPEVQPPSAGGTTRDRFETHTGNPCASACHALFDPIGFAFEAYDGIGQFRTTDNGSQVDSSGLIELDGQFHSFNDAMDLSAIFASSKEIKSCFARQWMRYAIDRNEFEDKDEPSINRIAREFVNSGNIQDLIVSITTSDSFLYRSPSAGEEVQ